MLTPCIFQASVAALRRTFSVIGFYMGVWCSECDRPYWHRVPVPLYHLQFSTGNFWLLALATEIYNYKFRVKRCRICMLTLKK